MTLNFKLITPMKTYFFRRFHPFLADIIEIAVKKLKVQESDGLCFGFTLADSKLFMRKRHLLCLHL